MAKIEKEAYLKKIDELNKKFGMGTIIGGADYHDHVEVVDTGSLTLNIATGLGGNPVGKLVEMFGPESSGKSTLSLHFMAEFQKAGKRCALVDFEQSFDKGYAKALGVDVESLFIIQPECMEDGYNIIEELIKTGGFGLITLDSHTAMIPKKALEGEIGDAKIALQARINSEALLKIKPLLLPNSCTMIGIAQLRTQIGAYGDPDKPSGGNAWKFYSDMRFKISKQLKKEDEANKTTVDVIKNKCVAEGQLLFVYPGIHKKVEELAPTDKLLSFNGKSYFWETFEIIDKYDDECFSVLSASGREVYLNREHPLLTETGYVPLREISIGTKVALTIKHPFTEDSSCKIPPRLLAMLLSDGDISGVASLNITDNREDLLEIVTEELKLFPNQEAIYKENKERCNAVVIRNNNGGHKGKPNALIAALKEVELFGKVSVEKFIPASVFNETLEYKAEFLLRYLFHDGWIEYSSAGEVTRLNFITSSPLLKEGLVRLLNSVEIFSKIRIRKAGKKGGNIDGRTIISKYHSYTIQITGIYDIEKFINLPFVHKESIAFIKNLNLGKKNRVSYSEVFAKKNLPYYWDKIKEIRNIGKKTVYTIHVPGTEVFDCGGFITHNCAPPFGKASFNINWGTGIDRLQEVIDLAVEFEFIAKGGAGWYTLKDDIKMQGDDKLKAFLHDNPGFAEELEEKVLTKIKEQ
jgi:recombination protein RecA